VQKISVDAGLSCPNRDGVLSTGGCLYCNERGSGTGAHARGIGITGQILAGKAALSKRYGARKFLVYFQSFSNTYAPLERLRELYAEALAVPDIVGLSIGTRPDCVSDTVLDLLEALGKTRLIWLEYGLQSANDATLIRINRGHDLARFDSALAAARRRNLPVCVHVILGLPGEKREDMLRTAEYLAGSDIQGIKIHLLYVAAGTELENLFRRGEFRCLEQSEYVALVSDFIERLPAGVVIQRLTGDPHPEELVAPSWSLRKAETLSLIQKSLHDRKSFQGSRRTDSITASPFSTSP
jgi:hypothetical protein